MAGDETLDLYVQAEALSQSGKDAEALALLDKLLSKDKSLFEAYFLRGDVLGRLKRPSEAAQSYLDAFRADPYNRLGRRRVMSRLKVEEAPALPEGSFSLFEDHFCLGCLGRGEPSETKLVEDFEQKSAGLDSLRVQAPPDRTWGLRLRLPPEFRGEALAKLADKGALVLSLESDLTDDSLELGFVEAPPDNGRPPAQNSLALDPYYSPGPGFQRVLLPLSEFPPLGYTEVERMHPGSDAAACGCRMTPDSGQGRTMIKGWKPPGGKLLDTGVKDRKEALFHWDRVEEVFLRGLPGPGDNRSFRVDSWALVPSYDEAAAKASVRAARQTRGADLLRSGLLLFGDRPLSLAYAFPRPENVLVVDETFPREGRASARMELDPSRWGGAGLIFPEKDLRPIRARGYLRFFVRGKDGGETFTPYLHSRRGPAERVVIRGPDSAALVDVSPQWKEVAIPLADFPDGGDIWDDDYVRTRPEVFHWDRVIEASFESPPVQEVENVIFLDSVRFTLDKPQKKGKNSAS